MADTTGGRRRLAAVWFADIVGYTTLSAENEDAALQVVGELQRIARTAVEARDGRVVKFIGDAVLTVFDSADSALHAALAVQAEFCALEIAWTHEVALRIGVHLGEVVEAADGDVYGDGVNTASRVEGAAEPGQVAVTEAVQRIIRNRPQFVATPLGERPLKGLSDPMPLYAVTLADAGAVRAPRRPTVKSARPGRALGLGTAAAIVSFFSLSIFVAQSAAPDGPTRTDTVTLVKPGAEAADTDAADATDGDAGDAGDAGGGARLGAGAPAGPEEAGASLGASVGAGLGAGPGVPPDGTPASSADRAPGLASPMGAWRAAAETDLLDDSRRVTISLASSRGAPATLVITCSSRRLNVHVAWEGRLTDAALRVRLDEGRDRDDRSQWTLLPDSLAVSYRGDPRRFLRDLLSARTWVAAAHTRSGDAVAQFALRGLDVAGEPLRDGCGWP